VLYFEFEKDGITYRRSTKTENKRDAEDIASSFRTKLVKGEFGLGEKPKAEKKTIAAACEVLWEDLKTRNRAKPKNRRLIDKVCEEVGSQYLEAFDSAHVRAYVAKLKGGFRGKGRHSKGRAASTIKHRLQILISAFKLENAYRKELGADQLVVPNFPKLKEGDARNGFLRPPQFAQLLQQLPGHLKDFCLFGYITGWRKGAVSSLEWSDVHDGNVYLRGVKSKSGDPYYVPIEGELAPLLENRRQARAVKRGLGVTFSNLVFHCQGRPIEEFRKSWATACKKANCPDTKFHDLRRSAARNLIRSGVHQSIAMMIGGWKTPSVFARYNIPAEEDLKNAVQKLERYTVEENAKVVAIQR
jgi:integrase